MKQPVSPKQVAQAIGISESSLKRWCDRGLLTAVRTAGGHRRLELDEVVQFLRKSGHKIQRPELLGLPSLVGHGVTVMDRARDQFREALVAGDEEQCRRIVFDLYLSGHETAEVCDRVMTGAFHDIGHDWESGQVAIYRERRACEMALRVLYDLRMALPAAAAEAPVACGGTLEHDPYCLPTAMVDVVLRGAGWQATSLGTMLPAATLAEAVRETQPDLLWISVSTIRSVADFLEEYSRLHDVASALGSAIAVGGRALTAEIRQQMSYSAYCDTLRHLVTFAGSLDRRARRRKKQKSRP